MKTYNYHHSKKIRLIILATLSIVAIITSLGIEWQQKIDQTEKTSTIIHELERELSRRKSLEKEEQFSFHLKQKVDVTSEADKEEFRSIPGVDAKLIDEPDVKRDTVTVNSKEKHQK